MRVGGGQAGQFHWPHVVANDTHGNMHVGEVDGTFRQRIAGWTSSISRIT